MSTTALFEGTPVIPVIEIESVADAAPLARALKAGGMRVIELTMRTPAALDAMKSMQDAEPDLLVGMGTILNTEMLDRAVSAGAQFLVTPGTPLSLLDALTKCGVPALPGVATGSEALTVLGAGFGMAKFFPAEAAGGAPYLKSLAGPIKSLQFCPTGGIGKGDVGRYLALPNVVCVGGSWVATKAMISAQNWAGIEANARLAMSLTADT